MPRRSRSSSITRRMPLRSDTSSIDTGSSATSTSGPRVIAQAMATRWRWPPESSWGNRSR